MDDSGSPSLHALAAAVPLCVLAQLALGAAARHKALGVLPARRRGGDRNRHDTLDSSARCWFATPVISRCGEARWPACCRLRSQVFLGIAAYMSRIATIDAPQPMAVMVGFTVAHVAVGALTLAASVSWPYRSFGTCAVRCRTWRPGRHARRHERLHRAHQTAHHLAHPDEHGGRLFLRQSRRLELSGAISLHTILGTGLIASRHRRAQPMVRARSGSQDAPHGGPSASLRPPDRRSRAGFRDRASVAGFAELWLGVNRLSGLLGLFTLLSYLFLYTPLKQRTPLSHAWSAPSRARCRP